MSHYFKDDPSLKSQEKEIEFKINDRVFSLISDRGVFSSKALDTGSQYFIETLLTQDLSGSGLDLGCGIGTISVVLKSFKLNLKLTLSDINERAVKLSQKNLNKYGFNDSKVVVSNLFEKLKDSYDFIYFNPPIRAGKKVIYDGFTQAYQNLVPDGRLYIVMRRDLGAESAIKELRKSFQKVEVLSKIKGYWVIVSQKTILKPT
jgi:16S rRNA (guanine1207-N2)-methyltransferase